MQTFHYTGTHPNMPADELAKLLDTWAEEYDGDLTPDIVVDKAQGLPGDHPVYKFFEWDAEKAAFLYQKEQARHILRCVVVRDEEKKTETRYHVNVRQNNEQKYVNVSRVIDDDVLYEQHLETLRAELQRIKQKYSHFEEFARIVGEELVEEGDLVLT